MEQRKGQLGEIEDALRAWLAEGRHAEGGDIVPDEDAIDSLEGVELVLHAEERWGTKIPDSELGRVCSSISLLAEAIASRQRVTEEDGLHAKQ